ncbi:cellulose binding domain-containing protein [Aquabacterium sp.]|uniref:cellulose binding domain-containing protein n=1 Tax=Aquabacterium sp. TaxID=1872578 RepID=UPI003D6CFFB4
MNHRNTVFGLALVGSIALGAAAHAATLRFVYKGTVIYTDHSLSGVEVGTVFTGTFSYDTATVADYDFGSSANYTNLAPHQFTATVAGHQISSNGVSTYVVDNFGGNVEDGVTISGGYPMSVDGGVFENGSLGLTVYSGPGQTGVLTSTAQPLNLDVKAFNAGNTLNYGWVQRDGGQTGGIIGFTIDNIARVCPVSHEVVSTQGGTFNATVTVTNQGAQPVSGWSVQWTYKSATILAKIKNATIAQSGFKNFTAFPLPGSKAIAPNGSVTFSFMGTKISGLPVLSGMTLKMGGQSCTLP